jgi:hypothetical protein
MTLALYPQAVRGLTWPVMKTHEFATIVQQAANFYTTRIAQSQNPIWHWTLIYEYLKDNPRDIVSALSPYTDYRFLEGFLLSNQGQFAEFLFNDYSDNAIGANPQAGGISAPPSLFQTSSYPQHESYYPVGSYVVDNNAIPHLQLVTVSGASGATAPTFSTIGGTTVSGGATFSDQGVFPGLNAQQVPLVTDGAFYYSPIQRNFAGQFLEDVTDLNTTVYPLTVWADGVQKTAGSDYQLLGPGLAIPGYSYEGMYIKWIGLPTGPITMLCQFYFRVRLESDQQDIEQFMQQLWTIGGASARSGSGMLKLISSRAALV